MCCTTSLIMNFDFLQIFFSLVFPLRFLLISHQDYKIPQNFWLHLILSAKSYKKSTPWTRVMTINSSNYYKVDYDPKNMNSQLQSILVLSQCKIHQHMKSRDHLANDCTNIHLIIDQFISCYITAHYTSPCYFSYALCNSLTGN